MHTYTSRRPADRTILTAAAVAAVVVAGAAIGLSQIDLTDRSDPQPAPVSGAPATSVAVLLPTLGDGPVPGMPAGTNARLTADTPALPGAVRLPTLGDGPVPGMPAGTNARLTADTPGLPGAVRLPTSVQEPVPGMPAGTQSRLVAQARRRAVLDAWPAPASTLDEIRSGPQR